MTGTPPQIDYVGKAMRVVRLEDLPLDGGSRELVGARITGGAGVCLIFVAAQPGEGPALHKHPYQEIFIVQG